MGHCQHCSFPREWGHMEQAGGGGWPEPLGLACGDATASIRGENGAVRADPALFFPVFLAGEW